jgi:hypothetical protein
MALSRTNVIHSEGNGGVAGTTFTTGSFTPPNNSLLVVCMGLLDTSVHLDSVTITDSLGTHLVYTKRVDVSETSLDVHRSVIWTAPVGVGASMTVTVGTGTAGTNEYCVHVLAYTGYNLGNPTGTTGTGINAATSFTLAAAPAISSEVVAFNSSDTNLGAAVITAGTGWTEIFHASDGANVDAQSQIRNNSTSTTVLWNASGNPSALVAVEIQAPSGGINIAKQNFKINKFKTAVRGLGPNAGLFQMRAYPAAAAVVDTLGNPIFRVRKPTWKW